MVVCVELRPLKIYTRADTQQDLFNRRSLPAYNKNNNSYLTSKLQIKNININYFTKLQATKLLKQIIKCTQYNVALVHIKYTNQ